MKENNDWFVFRTYSVAAAGIFVATTRTPFESTADSKERTTLNKRE